MGVSWFLYWLAASYCSLQRLLDTPPSPWEAPTAKKNRRLPKPYQDGPRQRTRACPKPEPSCEMVAPSYVLATWRGPSFVLADNANTSNGNRTTSGGSDGASDLGPRLLRKSSERVPIVAPYRSESDQIAFQQSSHAAPILPR